MIQVFNNLLFCGVRIVILVLFLHFPFRWEFHTWTQILHHSHSPHTFIQLLQWLPCCLYGFLYVYMFGFLYVYMFRDGYLGLDNLPRGLIPGKDGFSIFSWQLLIVYNSSSTDRSCEIPTIHTGMSTGAAIAQVWLGSWIVVFQRSCIEDAILRCTCHLAFLFLLPPFLQVPRALGVGLIL